MATEEDIQQLLNSVYDPVNQALRMSPQPGTYVALVHPSGDTTGATDVAAINTALATYGQAKGVPGATYYCNSYISPPSNSVLDMTGCFVNLVNGVLINLIRNPAANASRTVTDASTTAGSPVVTSATANFTNADVGTQIQVLGAGAGGSSWYGTIQSVGTSGPNTTATLNFNADLTVSGATANVFSTRDKNITIRGGNWHTPDLTGQGSGNINTTQFNSFATCFRRIDGLTVRDMTWSTAGSPGLGGRFTLSAGDVSNFTFDNIVFNTTSGDGVHVTGPATNGTLSNISGTTGDDMAVCNSQANTEVGFSDTQGNLTSISILNVRGVNTHNPVKVYGFGTTKKYTITDIEIDGVYGTSQTGAVIIWSTDTVGNISVRNVTATTSGSTPAVQLLPLANTFSIDIRNVVWTSTAASSAGIIEIEGLRGALKIRDVSMATNPAGTNIGVYFNSSGQNMGPASPGTSFGSAIDIAGVFAVAGNGSPPATFHAVSFDSGSSGYVQSLRVADVHGDPTSAGHLLLLQANFPVGVINISDCWWSGTDVVNAASGTNSLPIHMANVTCTGTNLVATSAPVTLALENVDVNTSGAVVAISGANATPVTVRAGNYSQAGAGAGMSRDGSQVLRAVGLNFKVDLALLSRATNGDAAFNSNSGTAAVGPFVNDGTNAAGSWHSLIGAAAY